MAEIIPGNFDRRDRNPPIIPFEKRVVPGNFSGEKKFSQNGVVEYRNGVRPRDDAGVNFRTLFHVAPIVETIRQAFPDRNFKNEITSEQREVASKLTYHELMELIESSSMQDWVNEPLEFMVLVEEIGARDLDVLN